MSMKLTREIRVIFSITLALMFIVICIWGKNNIVNAEGTNQTVTITWNGNGGYVTNRYDDTVDDYIDVMTSENSYNKGECINYNWPYPYQRNGYTFLGWKTDGDNTLYITYSYDNPNEYPEGQKYIGDYIATKNTTFKAQWADAYDITWDANGSYFSKWFNEETNEYVYDEPTRTNQLIKGKNISYNYDTPYEKEGYVFIGWKTDGDDTLYVTNDDDEYPEGQKYIGDYIPTKNTTFMAQWADAVTITFDGNGGYLDSRYDDETDTYIYDVSQKQLNREKGKSLKHYYFYPEERNGYIFVGWKTDNDETLYVTYNSSSYNSENIKYLGDYIVNSDITFKAQWAEAYDITWDANGSFFHKRYYDDDKYEYCDPTVISHIEKGKMISSDNLDTPYDLEGKIFIGWKTDDDDTLYINDEYEDEYPEGQKYIGNYIPTKNTTFKAQWADAINITWDGNGGFVDERYDNSTDQWIADLSQRITKIQKGTAISNNSIFPYDRDNYEFIGWKIDGDNTLYINSRYYNGNYPEGQKYIGDIIVDKPITFKAQWNEVYNITWDGNGGFVDSRYDDEKEDWIYDIPTYNTTVPKGENIDNNFISYAERSSYVFLGWKTDGDDTLYVTSSTRNGVYPNGQKFIGDYKITKPTTFKAQWGEACTITWDGNGGNVGSDTTSVAKGYVMDSNWCYAYRDGYTFLGWKIKGGDDTLYITPGSKYKELNGQKYINDYVVNNDVTFVCQWKEKSENDTLYSVYPQYYGYEFNYQDAYYDQGKSVLMMVRVYPQIADEYTYGFVTRTGNMAWSAFKEHPTADGLGTEIVFRGNTQYADDFSTTDYFYVEIIKKGHEGEGNYGSVSFPISFTGFNVPDNDKDKENNNNNNQNNNNQNNNNQNTNNSQTPDNGNGKNTNNQSSGNNQNNNVNPNNNQPNTQATTVNNVTTAKTTKKNTKKPAKKGTKLTDKTNKCIVKVTSSNAKNPTVTYLKSTNKNAKSVKIPATVKINGITYKVTAISDKAFSGNKKLTKITIGSNVKTIGKSAFKDCSKLRNVIIKSNNINKIGSNAFKGTYKNIAFKLPKSKSKIYTKKIKKAGTPKNAKYN